MSKEGQMMINNIPKPDISPNFTIDDIHKIREWLYERRKDATWEEQLADIKKGSNEFKIRLEERKRAKMLTSTVAFMERYLTDDEINKILGVIKMTRVANMLKQEERVEMAEELAKKMLLKGEPMDKIMEYTELTEKEIKEIQKRLKK
jgi:hypothetical protein